MTSSPSGKDAQEWMLSEIVKQIGVGVGTYTADGTVLWVNEYYAEMLGTDPTALEGEHITVTNPEFDRDRFEDYWASFEPGETRRHETYHQRLDDGSVFPVETITTCTTIDGRTFHIGTIEDITERKTYEQQLKEQRDNLETLNQVLRHDIRNDLQVVLAYAESLVNSLASETDEHGAAEKILDNASHAVELTGAARDMADVMLASPEDHQQIDLRRVLGDVLDEVRDTHSEAVIIEGSLSAVTVVADEMLDSVFRNLVKNAVQHNDKAVPEVTVSAEEREENVVVRIADNGPGVPDAQKEQIFGKGEKGLASDGTGLGLYLVQTLVENYGGDVWIEDNDPEGAVVVVELPLVE